jgi:hypothetical protein
MAGAQPRTSCRSLFKQIRDFTCLMPTRAFIKISLSTIKKIFQQIHLCAILIQGIGTNFID